MEVHLKILVADRSRLIVEALEAMFMDLDRHARVLTATTLQEAIQVVLREQPELIFVDAWIGVSDAGHAIRQVLECSPASSVFVMSTTCDPDFARRLRRAGARGCIEKEALPSIAQSILDGSETRP